MSGKSERPKVPKFATEAEEAKWWDEHMDMVEEELLKAMDNGAVGRSTAQRIVTEARQARNITIRMPEADLELARKQAEEKGQPYQTYIKSVLHEELMTREARRTKLQN